MSQVLLMNIYIRVYQEDVRQVFLLPSLENLLLLYSFYYKTSDKGEWNLLIKDVDGSILSTKEAGGFVGTYLGMYASKKHF